jgi:hypothetical protein
MVYGWLARLQGLIYTPFCVLCGNAVHLQGVVHSLHPGAELEPEFLQCLCRTHGTRQPCSTLSSLTQITTAMGLR